MRSFEQYQDELYHHGIKGMKWGVRRYQNADGSLTDLGKRHEKIGKSGSAEERTRAIRAQVSADYAQNSTMAQQVSKTANSGANIARRRENKKRERAQWKDASHMSDQDLQKAINRMNLERNYNSLQYDKVNAGKAHASDILATVGDVAAIGASVAIMGSVIYKLKS